MTRVTDFPELLCDEHLRAQLRELTRIPNELKQHPNRKPSFSKTFTLNAGHVKFYRDKLLYLRKIHIKTLRECRKRGFKAVDRWPTLNCPQNYYKSYTPTDDDLKVMTDRWKKMHPKKAHYFGEKVVDFYDFVD